MIYEMQEALKRNERVELRDIFTIEPRRQKARVSRNPKTNEKVNTPEKKSILFKMSKEWAKKVNEKEDEMVKKVTKTMTGKKPTPVEVDPKTGD